MADWVHHALATFGFAGLAGFWLIKALLGLVVLRVVRLRRAKMKG
jgi:uncharacterized membrane protein|tara:strand:+ start:2499 stop:2633 length:135 start_codon:yes stop_codon:yes gene_type:complete